MEKCGRQKVSKERKNARGLLQGSPEAPATGENRRLVVAEAPATHRKIFFFKKWDNESVVLFLNTFVQ